MSEGTKVYDARDETAKLHAQVAMLEKAIKILAKAVQREFHKYDYPTIHEYLATDMLASDYSSVEEAVEYFEHEAGEIKL